MVFWLAKAYTWPMNTPIDWPSLPATHTLSELSLESLKHYEKVLEQEEPWARELPDGLEQWVAAQVPAESVTPVLEKLRGAMSTARYEYATQVRKASERMEKATLPAGYSLQMIAMTQRFSWAHAWGLFSAEQTEALAPRVKDMHSVVWKLRAGEIPSRHPRWGRFLSEAAQVLGQTPSTLLDAIEPTRLRAFLLERLDALGPFAPTDAEIERTRIQSSSWGNDLNSSSAFGLLKKQYDSSRAFLSDWLTDVEASLKSQPAVVGPRR